MTANLSAAISGVRGANEIYRQNYEAIAATLNLNATAALASPAPKVAAHDEITFSAGGRAQSSAEFAAVKKVDFQFAENSAVVQVRDAETGEMILQIPSEEMLAAQRQLAQVNARLFP